MLLTGGQAIINEDLSHCSSLASTSPLAKYWYHPPKQGFEGKDDGYVAVGQVLDLIKASMMLIRNASHITQSRRSLNRQKI